MLFFCSSGIRQGNPECIVSSFIIFTNVVSLSHFSPQMIKVNTACTVITVRQLCNNASPILTIYVTTQMFSIFHD